MFPFSGSVSSFAFRPTLEQSLNAIALSFIPEGGFDPVAKAVIANVINAVGQRTVEQGVLDTPQPSFDPVLPGPTREIPTQTDGIDWIPGWPDVWKKETGGWIEDDWVLPEDKPMPGIVDIISGAIDIAQGQPVGGFPGIYDVGYDAARGDFGSVGQFGQPFVGAAPSNGKVTVDTKTGKVTTCRRRRRRPLLTCTDLNTLAALKTIVGGGQALNFAVMKAVRR